MKKQNQTLNLSVGIVASVCALAVVVGGGIFVTFYPRFSYYVFSSPRELPQPR